MNKEMPRKRVEIQGLSKTGSLDEALADAIQKSKQSLQTDLVRWELISVYGENGGFIRKNELVVRITATGPI